MKENSSDDDDGKKDGTRRNFNNITCFPLTYLDHTTPGGDQYVMKFIQYLSTKNYNLQFDRYTVGVFRLYETSNRRLQVKN